ncbi:MAG: Asp-tRNA(Asn)/Glu-tRNA(Gln) amidotransferase GatCAB subunit B, partial [Clostridia bacterium]|nr:Asp-tRNA(Asn)/Glu-tRNA(Gln) amidotransferase GatCAB subunit B [Clostridia bacterium]
AIAADPKAVRDYKSGKEKAIMSIFGKCMKELKGNCYPQTIRQILVDLLKD